MNTIYVMYMLSALLIILGFIALLSQKNYVDKDAKKVTEVEIPILGKLKTNYPSLVFVFLGVFIAYISFDRSKPISKNDWKITGSFKSMDNEHINWPKGELKIFPSDFEQPIIKADGTFEIHGRIEDGKTFEDIVERIDFSCPEYSAIIYPNNEYKKYKETRDSSLLRALTNNSRDYKVKTVEKW